MYVLSRILSRERERELGEGKEEERRVQGKRCEILDPCSFSEDPTRGKIFFEMRCGPRFHSR